MVNSPIPLQEVTRRNRFGGFFFRLGHARWLREMAGVSLLFIVVTLAMTWPLVRHLTTQVPGIFRMTDTPIFLWSFWWFQERFADWFPNPYGLCRMMYYPLGAPLSHHTPAFLYAFLSFPLRSWLGAAGVHNIVILANFTAACLSMYCLGRYIKLGVSGALLAAVIYAFSPFRMFRLEQHLNFMGAEFFALYLLGLLTLLDARDMRQAVIRGLLAGGVFVCAFYVELTNALFLALLSTLFMLWLFCTRPASKVLFQVAAGLSCAAVLTLVLTYPVLHGYAEVERSGATFLAETHRDLSASLLSFFIPSGNSRLGTLLWARHWPELCRISKCTYLGYLPLGLALAGIWYRPRDRRIGLFAALFLGFALLSMGPVFQLGNEVFTGTQSTSSIQSEILLPAYWILKLPVLEKMRDPSRFHMLTSLGLALLAGIGFQRLIRGNGWTPCWAAVLLFVVAAEYAVTIRTYAVDWDALQPVRADTREGVVLDGNNNHRGAIERQIFHQKPMVMGLLARTPPDRAAYINSTPLLGQFGYPWADRATGFIKGTGAVDAVREAVQFLQLRYAIFETPEEIYKKVLFEGVVPFMKLSATPHYEVYEITPQTPLPLQPQTIKIGEGCWSLYLGEGWGQAWRRVHILPDTQERVLWPGSPSSTVLFRCSPAEDIAFTMDTWLPGTAPESTMELALNGHPLATIEIGEGYRTVDLILPAQYQHEGINEVSLTWCEAVTPPPWKRAGVALPGAVYLGASSEKGGYAGDLQIRGQSVYKNAPGLNIVTLSKGGTRVINTASFLPGQEESLMSYIMNLPEGYPVVVQLAGRENGPFSVLAQTSLALLGIKMEFGELQDEVMVAIGAKGLNPGEAIQTTGIVGSYLAPGRNAVLGCTFAPAP